MEDCSWYFYRVLILQCSTREEKKERRRCYPTGNDSKSMSSSTASSSSSSSKTPHISPVNTNNERGTRFAADHEEDRNARVLLKQHGFDSNNLNKECNGMVPMNHFIAIGNLPMCRYLFSRGAKCRTTDRNGYFSLFFAALRGHLEVLQWLCRDTDAHEDIRKETNDGISPLRIAFYSGHFHIVWWLLLNGALAPEDDGAINDTIMRHNFSVTSHRMLDKRLTVLAWVRDAVATHDKVKVFLTGTIVSAYSFRRHPKNPYATRSKRTKVASSSLVILKGKAGILELIAQYVAGTPQQRRTLRQLRDRLPAFIADVPFVDEIEKEDEDD